MYGWFLAHFPDFYSVDPNPNYIENYPVAAKWTLQKGHGEGVTYRSLLDHLQFDDVCWRPYEEHRKIQGFEEVFWYSGWITCSVVRVYRHLPERVLRQYKYVQTILRHPTNVVDLRPPQIVQAFIEFRTHTLNEPDWGESAGKETWRMRDGYVLWYITVSQQMKSISLHSNESDTRREALLIPMTWLEIGRASCRERV